MWPFIARLILRNRLAFLLLIGVITVFMGWRATKVKLSYDLARTLPETEEAFIDYKEFKDRFGEDGAVLVVGIKPPNIFSKEIFNSWDSLGTQIKELEGIEEVVSLTRLVNVIRNDSLRKFETSRVVKKKVSNQEELDSLKTIILGLHVYDSLLYNPVTGATLMAITLDKNKLNTANRIAVVDNIVKQADAFGAQFNLDMHYSGLPFIRTAITRMVAREMVLFICLALLVTSIILYLFFRSFKAVFFSLLVVIVGVIWSFGTLELFGYKISILTGLIPPLIIIIGVPNCILLLNKYQTEFTHHGNKIKSLARTISSIGMTIFLANVTTAIGFGVFYFTNTRLLMEFGLVSSLNVMTTYAISLILIPIIFSFLSNPDTRHTSHLQGKRITALLQKIDFLVHHKRRRIYITVGIIIAISLVGMSQINTVGFIVDDLPGNHPIYVDLKFFEKNFHGVMPFEISVDTKKENGVFADNAKALYKIKALQRVLAEYPELSRPVSLVELGKFFYQSYRDGNPKYYILPAPSELNKMKEFVNNSLGTKNTQFKSMIDSARQVTRITVAMEDIGSKRMSELVEKLKPRVDSIFDPSEYNVKLTGNTVMFAAGNNYLVQNLRESLVLAIILICIVMITLFMSVRMISVSVLPSILPLMITAALMGFLAIALKPSSILIFSIAFGIASDGTIYFLTKYRQEIKGHHYSISKAVSLTIRETGVSMVYTAIILFSGFGIFAASKFGGTASLGILISITLLIAYCSNLVLLPAILLSLEKRLTTKAFLSEPLIQVYDEEADVDLDELEIKK